VFTHKVKRTRYVSGPSGATAEVAAEALDVQGRRVDDAQSAEIDYPSLRPAAMRTPGCNTSRMAGGTDPRAGPAGAEPPGWTDAPGTGPDVPVGAYEPFQSSPFIDLVGSMWVGRGDGAPWLRLCVEASHGNKSGLAHGGVLMTFADVVLAQGIRAFVGEPLRLATVGLTVDFVRPVAIGAWVDGRAEVQRGSGRTVFANCFLMSEAHPVVRASGIYVVSTGRDGGAEPPVEPTRPEGRP
jgi:uncharacterized protein (TIGR00369 family)